MEIKVQVSFQQILTLVRTLTPIQKAKLRKELDKEIVSIQEKEKVASISEFCEESNQRNA